LVGSDGRQRRSNVQNPVETECPFEPLGPGAPAGSVLMFRSGSGVCFVAEDDGRLFRARIERPGFWFQVFQYGQNLDKQ
jgi:hypothetical protein